MKKQFSQIYKFHQNLKCSQHPNAEHQTQHSLQPKTIVYAPGQLQIPVIKCERIDDKYVQKQIRCQKFLSALAEHGNDYFEYIQHLEKTKNQRGNNKAMKLKIARQFQAYLQWETVENRKILIQKKYFCHNTAIHLPKKMQQLVTKKPKLIYSHALNATILERPFPKHLLLKQPNNFRQTIQSHFGKDSFSKNYHFSASISKLTIQISDLYPFSQKRNLQFKELIDIHDRLPLEIKKSTLPMGGNGVFTLKRLPKNVMLMFYVGQQRNAFENWPPSDSVYDLGFIEKHDQNHQNQSENVFPLVVEPIRKLNAARYINTCSTRNNLKMQKVIANGIISLLLSTGDEEIQAGSQLFYSYGSDYGFGEEYLKVNDPKGGSLNVGTIENQQISAKWKKMIKKEQKNKITQLRSGLSLSQQNANDEKQQVDIQQMEEQMPQPQHHTDSDQSKMSIQKAESNVQDEIFYSSQSQRIEQEKDQGHPANTMNQYVRDEYIMKQQSQIVIPRYLIPQSDQKQDMQMDQYRQHLDIVVPPINKSQQQRQSVQSYLNTLKDGVKSLGSDKLTPAQKISKLYRCYSRINYRRYSLKYPRMKEAEKIGSIIKGWQSMNAQQKIALYRQYIVNQLLDQQNSDRSSESQEQSNQQKSSEKAQKTQFYPHEERKKGVRVFIMQSQDEKPDHDQLDNDSQSKVQLEIKIPQKYQRYISFRQFRNYLYFKLASIFGNAKIDNLNSKKHSQMFQLCYGQTEIFGTQRQRLRQYRHCLICKRKQSTQRLGNHLKLEHKNIRNMILTYIKLLSKNKFWIVVHVNEEFPTNMQHWQFDECVVKHQAYKNLQLKLLSGVAAQQVSNQRIVMLMSVLNDPKNPKVKVQCERIGRKTILKPSKCQMPPPQISETAKIVDLVNYLSNLKNASVVNQKGQALSKQKLIADLHFKNRNYLYLNVNGKVSKLLDPHKFLQKQKRIKKQKNIIKYKSIKRSAKHIYSKMIQQQSPIPEPNVEKGIELQNIQGNFKCPICNRQYKNTERHHIMSCLKYTKMCEVCDRQYPLFTKHVCLGKCNSTIEMEGFLMQTLDHAKYVMKKQIQSMSKENLEMVQPQCQIQNIQLKQLHQQSQKRKEMNSNQRVQIENELQEVNQFILNVLPDFNKGPAQLLSMRANVNQPRQIKQSHADQVNFKRQILKNKLTAILKQIQKPNYFKTINPIKNREIKIAGYIIKAKLERQQWIQSHNTCAICLSQISPHIMRMRSILTQQLIMRPESIISKEIQRLGNQRTSEISTQSILKYANNIAIRQCIKCKKIYHRACWQNQAKTTVTNTRCANCREQQSIYPPESVLLDGSQSQYSSLIDNIGIKQLLEKLGLNIK